MMESERLPLALLSGVVADITKDLEDVAALKRKASDPETSSAGAKAALAEARGRFRATSMRLLELRRLNRETWRAVDAQRASTAHVRETVDATDLRLQNLQYERVHFEREIWECTTYAPRCGEAIELVDERTFWAGAPAALRQEATAPAAESETARARTLQLCRLRHEQAMRAELAAKLGDVRARCDAMRSANGSKGEFLKSLLPQLEALANASLGAQNLLGLRLTSEYEERAKAQLLPPPLRALHVRLLAVRDVLAPPSHEQTRATVTERARTHEMLELTVCGDVDRARLELRAAADAAAGRQASARAGADAEAAAAEPAAAADGDEEAEAAGEEADEGSRKRKRPADEAAAAELHEASGGASACAAFPPHALSLELALRVDCGAGLRARVEAGGAEEGALSDDAATGEIDASPPPAPTDSGAAPAAKAAAPKPAEAAAAAGAAASASVQAVRVRFSYHQALRAVCARVVALEPNLPGLSLEPLLARLLSGGGDDDDGGRALPPSARAPSADGRGGGAALLQALLPAVPYGWLQRAAGLAPAPAPSAEEGNRACTLELCDAIGALAERVRVRTMLVLQQAALKRAMASATAAATLRPPIAASGAAHGLELHALAARLGPKAARPARLLCWAALGAAEANELLRARRGLVGGPALGGAEAAAARAGACRFVAVAFDSASGARLQLLLTLHVDHPRTRPRAHACWLAPPASAALPALPPALLRLSSTPLDAARALPASGLQPARCDNNLVALEAGIVERAARADDDCSLLRALDWMLDTVHTCAQPDVTRTHERTVRGRDRRKVALTFS